VSYGFPNIIFCNPGVHYETPCTRGKEKYTRFSGRKERKGVHGACSDNGIYAEGEKGWRGAGPT
jgi:hypothetical protein